MKILIFGGTGFVGPHVVRSLAALGHQVRVFHRGEHMIDLPAGAKKINADLSSLGYYEKPLQIAKYDVVVHMIAATGADAREAVETFSGHAGRVVVASSFDVYRTFAALLRKEECLPTQLPLEEDADLRTVRKLYGDDRDKLEVERAFRAGADRLPVTILRLPFMYGPNDPRQRFFSHVKRFDDQRPAILLEPAYGNYRMTHAYVENVAHAFVLAITTPHAADVPVRTYNVGQGPTTTTAERLHELARAAGYRGKIIVVPRDRCPEHLIKPVDLRHDLVLNDSAIRRELGYTEMVAADEGYRRTIAWQRTICPLPVDLSEFNYEAEDRLLQELGMA